MKHLGKELKSIILAKNLVQKDIAESLGISPASLQGIFGRESMDCKRLEEICKLIHVNPMQFFDVIDTFEPSTELNSEIKNLQKENELLLQWLEEKERTIQILMEAH